MLYRERVLFLIRKSRIINLLLTQAKDKNYVLHTDDSLINIAVNYYDSIGDIEEAAKAHYYLARVYQDMQNEVGAVCEYLTALPLAERHKGSTILYLLYGNLGQIYFQQDLLSKADSLFALSESIAIQKNDSFNLTMGLVVRWLLLKTWVIQMHKL